MRAPVGIPLMARHVEIAGSSGTAFIDLILDTGSSHTVLSQSVLKVIGYDPAVAMDRETVVTTNGTIEVPRLEVKSIRWGDVSADAVDVVCHDIPELTGVRGLLGLSFLRRFRTVLDYREGYLEVT